jgi:hypothetical protein
MEQIRREQEKEAAANAANAAAGANADGGDSQGGEGNAQIKREGSAGPLNAAVGGPAGSGTVQANPTPITYYEGAVFVEGPSSTVLGPPCTSNFGS